MPLLVDWESMGSNGLVQGKPVEPVREVKLRVITRRTLLFNVTTDKLRVAVRCVPRV